MNENRYTELLDDLMIRIEDEIDETGLDIDFETSAGILTLTCPDNSKVILSRQTPLLQLWLTARSGGFHFNYDEQKQEWVLDSNGKTFSEIFNRSLSEQYGEPVELAL